MKRDILNCAMDICMDWGMLGEKLNKYGNSADLDAALEISKNLEALVESENAKLKSQIASMTKSGNEMADKGQELYLMFYGAQAADKETIFKAWSANNQIPRLQASNDIKDEP